MNTDTMKRRVRRVFTFNVMVVGATGLGKTTFVKTLMADTKFNFNLPQKQDTSTVSIEVYTSEIELNDRKMQVTIIDTPGFGDRLDNTDSCKLILDYVEEQFRVFLREETKIQRNPKFLDPRIHAVLYFLEPTAHNLSEIDIEFMRTLGRSTNIIPVIGRADSVSDAESRVFKKKLLEQIAKHNLNIYTFPIFSDDDENYIQRNNALEDKLPFALVGSVDFHEVNGKQVRGRKYPWGVVEVDNPDHCDFLTVKEVLLHTHTDILKEDTHEIHYEYYRKHDLIRQQMGKDEKQAEVLYKDVLTLKETEEAEMKARKRKSRVSVSSHQGPPNLNQDPGTRFS